MKTIIPLQINYSLTLQIKCSLLLYTLIIISLLLYVCPLKSTYIKKILNLQSKQNKFLRITLKAPWFMRNKHLYNDSEIPFLDI